MDTLWREKMFNVFSGDTDSIMFCKRNMNPFTKEERSILLDELNSLYPDHINWSDDGYFETVVVLKAKNYILYDGKKIKIKGSSLRSSKLEASLKDIQKEFIDAIIYDRNNFLDIYNKYIYEAMNITDIKRWSSRKTITSKTETSERANETKLMDAIAGSNYKEGDKCLVYFLEDASLCLAENYTGAYDKLKMTERVFKCIQVFANVIDMTPFLNYKLKKNKKALDELLVRSKT